MWRASPLLNRRWVRVAAPVVDSLLLASAVTLALMSGQYPIAQAWLTAKLLALLAYIGVGLFALRRGPNRRVRALNWTLAMIIYAYIVAVALTRQPWPWS